jgi:hypothetical protein
VAAFALAAGFVVSEVDAQQARHPAMHRRIPHPEAQAGATFGWTGAFGNVEDPLLNTVDDLVLSSLKYNLDLGGGSVVRDLGAAFTYRDESLDPHPFNAQVLPQEPWKAFYGMGQRDVAIADLRRVSRARVRVLRTRRFRDGPPT